MSRQDIACMTQHRKRAFSSWAQVCPNPCTVKAASIGAGSICALEEAALVVSSEDSKVTCMTLPTLLLGNMRVKLQPSSFLGGAQPVCRPTEWGIRAGRSTRGEPRATARSEHSLPGPVPASIRQDGQSQSPAAASKMQSATPRCSKQDAGT